MSKIKYAKSKCKMSGQNELIGTESTCENQQWFSLLEVIKK